MARARVVLPTPRPPCKATTSRGRRRLASSAPSRSVAASSGKEKEKVGTGAPMPTFNTPPAGGVCGSMGRSVAVEVTLERAGLGHADILGLVRAELGELGADLLEMERRDLLVEELGQGVDLLLVLARVGPQLDLGQRLVGERGRHHEARMSGGVAEVHQAAFRQDDDALAVGELDLVDLRLDVVPLEVPQVGDLDLGVEVADVADDGAVLHRSEEHTS